MQQQSNNIQNILIFIFQNHQNRLHRPQPDEDEDELFRELTRILFESLEIVDNIPKGLLLHKIFLELEKESELENFIVEKLKHSQVKMISEFLETYLERATGQIGENEVKHDQYETLSRGFKEDLMEAPMSTGDSKMDISCKLERFKVKIVTIEGAVDQEIS